MTQTPTAHDPAQGQARAQFTVPAKHPMVTVLGSGDALLRVIEKAFPAADIHVRGNEISAVGDAGEVALVQRLFDEMMLVLRTGQPMTEDAVERSIAMLRASENGEGDGQETPAEVLTQNILSSPRPHHPPQDPQPEALRRRDRQAHDRVRHRPRRYRQDVSRHGQGGPGPAVQAGQPDHPDPARRSRRASGSASCPARSTRRSTRICARCTTRCTTCSTRTRSRG